jgi:hypothetical protein
MVEAPCQVESLQPHSKGCANLWCGEAGGVLARNLPVP